MNPLNFILIVLATFRLAFMLVNEDGPLRIFDRLRSLTTLGGILECWHCCSVWVALAGVGVFLRPATWQEWIVWALAASGAAVAFGRFTGFDYQR